ncbi:teneurin-2-like [Pimephales promelas]|uniref:teneurin-2-like n=1 Tax=Pimephales promelas TaxID=90988 RepID=UPI001955D502|nr:teneurin-2-like [Pimephales promelas]
MDLKERRHRTLTHGRCGKDFQFTTSSLDNDECRVPTQKSYSSSETLKAFDHDSRLHYGGCVADLVHHEADEFTRQGEYMDFSPFLSYFNSGNFTLAELGICEPSPHQNAYCPEIGLLQHGYSLSAGSDADSDPEGPISPERAIQLWGGQGIKSRRSSGLSSRENSALTLTDSDNENKSDDESAYLEDDVDDFDDPFGDIPFRKLPLNLYPCGYSMSQNSIPCSLWSIFCCVLCVCVLEK